MKQVIMTIKPDGEISIETEGFSGSMCVEETQFIKDALGEETAQVLKPCYFGTVETGVKRKLKPLCG